MANWNNVRQTGEEYVREYLDPDNAISAAPMTEEEARKLYYAIDRTMPRGSGMDVLAFVNAVGSIQAKAGFKGW